jgi:hypothetical protein
MPPRLFFLTSLAELLAAFGVRLRPSLRGGRSGRIEARKAPLRRGSFWGGRLTFLPRRRSLPNERPLIALRNTDVDVA